MTTTNNLDDFNKYVDTLTLKLNKLLKKSKVEINTLTEKQLTNFLEQKVLDNYIDCCLDDQIEEYEEAIRIKRYKRDYWIERVGEEANKTENEPMVVLALEQISRFNYGIEVAEVELRDFLSTLY